MKQRQVTQQRATPWPFLYSVVDGRLVKNVPVPAPTPKPDKRLLRSGQK